MDIHALETPCCHRNIEFEAVLRIAEWASNVPQFEIWQWNYYRCPHCATPCWFGYSHDGGEFGIFGAAPVADLIPISREPGMPVPDIGPESVTFQYRGACFEIQRGKYYWKSA